MSYRTKALAEISREITDQYPWKTRKAARDKMVLEYLERFKNISTIYLEAISGGYGLGLWRYVQEIANIQAQMIITEPNGTIGWDSVICMGDKVPSDSEAYRFINYQKQQADTGSIDVAIPSGAIGYWKKNVEWIKPQIAT